MQIQQARQRRDFLQQQWRQYGSAVLALSAALGWGLYLWERHAGGRRRTQTSSPTKGARGAPSSHRLLVLHTANNSLQDELPAAYLGCGTAEEPPSPQQRQQQLRQEDERLQLPAGGSASVAAAAAESECGERQQALAQQLEAFRGELLQARGGSAVPSSDAADADACLEHEEERLCSLAAELEVLRAELNQDLLASALSGRGTILSESRVGSGRLAAMGAEDPSAAAALAEAGNAPALQAAEQAASSSSSTSKHGLPSAAMASFQQRLTPLALRPVSSWQQPPLSPPLHASLQPAGSGDAQQPEADHDSWLLADEVVVGSPASSHASPSHQHSQHQPEQQQAAAWSPKPTVAGLAELQRRSSVALDPPGQQSWARSGSASTGCSPVKAGTPASLGRMLRQTVSGRSLGGQQLSRSLATYSEAQQALASARKALAAGTAGGTGSSSGGGLYSPGKHVLRSDTSMLDRPASAPLVQRRGLPRPPTPTGGLTSSGGGDEFRIGAFRPGSSSSVGNTPRGGWPRAPSPAVSGEAPGSSRIPKPRGAGGWSPATTATATAASTPGSDSRIPRPADAW